MKNAGGIRTTERLILRPPVSEDGDAYFEIHGDPQTNRFNPSGAPDKEKAAAGLASCVADWHVPGFGYWAVAVRDAPGFIIGFGGVRRKEFASGPALNLYFRFRPSVWGKGFATELAAASLAFAFDVLRERKVLAVVRPDNQPSRKTLERAGLSQIGDIDDVLGQSPSLLYEIKSEDFAVA